MREAVVLAIVVIIGGLAIAIARHNPVPAVETTAAPAVTTTVPTIEVEPVSTIVVSLPEPSPAVAVNSTQPAHDPLPAPTRVYAPAVPSGRYELRSVKVGPFRRENQWVWVSYQPQPQSNWPANQTYGGRSCAGGRCR